MTMMEEQSGFVILCEGCNQPLIQRLSNGIWKFKWGAQRKVDEDGNDLGRSMWTPIEFLAHGSLRLKCFRKSCAHWNELTFLPNVNEIKILEQLKEHSQEIEKLLSALPRSIK